MLLSLILRARFGVCRINHLLRALPFVVGKPQSVDVGLLFRLAFVDCVADAGDPSHFGSTCFLSFSGGGGLRDPEKEHEAAFLASVFIHSGCWVLWSFRFLAEFLWGSATNLLSKDFVSWGPLREKCKAQANRHRRDAQFAVGD